MHDEPPSQLASQEQPTTASAEPLVSVVVCFLNARDFLAEAVQSLFTQSHRRWELLLVDDGSTDGSSDLARQYAAKYPEQIFYFEHPQHQNLGKSSSRNVGIRAARGSFVVFLDADDVLLPHKLEHQVQLFDEHPTADAVIGRTRYWYSWSDSPTTHGSSHPKKALSGRDSISRLWIPWNRLYEPPELMIRYLRQPGAVPCLCALMVRRSFLERLGGFDEAIQQMYEDQVLFAKLALSARCWIDTDVGENYRQHPGSTSAQAIQTGTYHPWRPNASRRDFLNWLADYTPTVDAGRDLKLQREIRRATRPYRHPLLYSWWAPLSFAYRSLHDRCWAFCRPEPAVDEPANSIRFR